MPVMRCFPLHVFLGCCLCCFYYQVATSLDFLPPPLFVTCSKPENRVYQRHDNELRISCLWDGHIEIHYSRLPRMNSREEESDFQPPPYCHWYQDSVLVKSTNLWSGNLTLSPGLLGDSLHSPQAYSQITIQCTSASCPAPLCFHHNLSIEVSKQDVHLFLIWPRTHPILEWQPVHLAWCARLKSSTWLYHFRSEGGSPASLLIPSNQHTELPPFTADLNAEMYQVCKSYYSYHLTVRYLHRGFYTASISIEHGPQISLAMDILVEAALLHVFSANSKLLNHPHGNFSFSWSFLQLSQGIVAYKLLNMHGTRGWSHSYNYNPFALHSNFCAVHKPHRSKEKVTTIIYFQANERLFGALRGKLDFSNKTLILSTRSAISTYLTLNPQKVKVGTYIVSHTLGVFYSFQDGSTATATDRNSSSHYIFYQQASFSYLIIAEFVELQLSRFSMHIYLNRKGSLFKALAEKEIELHVFNSTFPKESLVYIVWFIPVQHPLLQCEWTFNLQLFDSKYKNLTENHTFGYLDHVRNATQFIPDSVVPFNPALYTGFVANVNCTGNGLIPTILKATFNTYASKVIESRIACQQKPCSITKITIRRHETSTFIIHYAPGTEFILAADTQMNCPGPKKSEVIWNIYKVPDMTSTPNWTTPFNPAGVGRRNVTTLKIPSFSLDDGLYLFNFTMKLTSLDTWHSIKSSDSVFVEIGPNNLVAAIAGGNFRTVSFSDQWTLNGSVFSNGKAIQSFQRLSFTWYCTKHKTDYVSMTLSKNGKCHPDQLDLKWPSLSDPVQTVKPKTLQGSNTYYFLLVVQYGSRTVHTEQAVYVQVQPTLILNVSCIENCDKSVIPTERFCLSGKCINCRTSKLTYYWSLHSTQSNEIDFDWSSKTTTGRSNPYLRINAFAFVTMVEQLYILSLKIITMEGQLAIYKYSFYVNGPPRLGKCAINPQIGTAFLTKFIIQCNGFEDKNEPLTYKVTAAYNQMKINTIPSIENSTLGITVYAGHDYKTQSFLPSGVLSQNSALVLYIQVYDALGASSQVTLQATVHDKKENKSPDVIHHELNTLISGPRAPLRTLWVTKDYFNIGYFVYMVASVLNNIEVSSASQDSKSDLRQILLNMTAEIPTNTTQEINQVILSICQVTHESMEVNRESLLLAVKKLKEVTEALKRQRDKDLGSKETEILANGVLIGLSNMLKASLLHNKNVSNNVVKETMFVMEELVDLVLRDKVPGENETMMETEGWSIHLQKYEKWELLRNASNRKYCKNCFYPRLKQGRHTELHINTVVTTVFYVFNINPFPWLLFTENIRTIVSGFKMTGTKPNGEIISIMPDVAEIILSRKDEATFDLTVGPDKMLSKTTGGFSFETEQSTKDLFMQIVSKINITFQVFIYLGHNISHPPIATYTVSHHSPPTPTKNNTNIPACIVKAPYVLCLPLPMFWSPLYNNTEDKVNVSIVLQSQSFVREPTTKVIRIALFAAECLDLGGIQKQWKKGTCSLGPETSWSKIHCICKARKHSTRTASPMSAGTSEPGIRFLVSKVLLFPNHTDMKMSLLRHVTQYPITGLTILLIFIAYTILAIWVLVKGKVGRKDKVICLLDNDPFDKIRYLVTIYTGSRPSAGTKAKVFIELIGQDGVSAVHHLKHPRILRRGSIDTFLLTTNSDLGDMLYFHVWHDNCRFGPNWYLSRVKVQNLETKESWLFLCRKWLALGIDDFQIERSFSVTSPNAPISKMDYFSIMFSNNMRYNHMWLSIFTRKGIHGPSNKFQRLSSCLVILLSSLTINSFFFITEKEQFIYSLGLQYLRSIRIGIRGAFISIPVQVIVTTLFKYSLKRPSSYHTAQGLQEESPFRVSEGFATEGSMGNARLAEMKSQPFAPTNAKSNNNRAAKKKTYFEKTKPQVHYCFAFIAWAFVFCVSIVTSLFIILEGLSYDDKTSLEWLLASITSFCLHVFFVETLKVVIVSAWNIGSAKYCQNIPWPNYQDIQFKDKTQTKREMIRLHRELTKLRASKKYQPLKEDVVTILRKRQRIQNLAYVFMKNMVCHFVFLTLILTVTQPTEITTFFYSNQYMYEKFSAGLSEVNTVEDIYAWIKNVFLPLIHNDHEPTYLSNTWSKVLGLPRMRQIRSQGSMTKCFFPYGLANALSLSDVHCQKKYGIDPEDQADYNGSWTKPISSPSPNGNRAFLGFTYEYPVDQWEYPSYGELNIYPSGGYSFYFFPEEPKANSTIRLEALEMSKWLDDDTWVLIIELTTFNPDADLYCSISVIFEFSYIGPLNSSVSVNSYKLPLLTDQSTGQIFLLLATVYMLITYIADECVMLYKNRLKYIKTAANLINFGMKTICIIYIVLLLYKFQIALELVQFYLHNPYHFIPFHAASEFDQVVKKIMGILFFLLILKTYRYFRFMYGVRLAQKSLFAALPTMISLSVAGAIFFFAFISVGYLAFGQHETTFRTVLYSFTTVLSYCALAFRDTEFSSDRLLGGFFLGFFLVVMICIFVNLSQVIIISAHVDMKETVYEFPSHEAEVIYYMIQKIYWIWVFLTTGRQTTTETGIFNWLLFGKPERPSMQEYEKPLI